MKRLEAILLLIFSLTLATGVFLTVRSYQTPPSLPPNPTLPTNVVTNVVKRENAFVPFMPNFDSLKTDDLPGGVEKVFPYKDTLVKVSSRITIVNKVNDQIIKINNPDVINCGYTSAMIDQYLYVGCQGKFHPKTKPSKLYRINMDTETLDREYFNVGPLKDLDFTNIEIESENQYLYIKSWDGLTIVNNQSEEIEHFTNRQIFGKECRPNVIMREKNILKIPPTRNSFEPQCETGVAIIDTSTNKIRYEERSMSEEISEYFNNRHSMLHSPNYLTMSEKINDKYYIFAVDGMYTLTRNDFTKKLNSIKVYSDTASAADQIRTYVTKDEKYAIILGDYYCRIHDCGQAVIQLINLKTNTLSNLTTLPDERDPQIGLIGEAIRTGKFREEANLLTFYTENKGINTPIFTVDLNTKKLIVHKVVY